MSDEEIEEKINKNGHKKYNPNKEGTKVICVTTGKKFISAKKASEYYGIDSSAILKNCRGKAKSVGCLDNGTRLVWMRLSEYDNQQLALTI